MTWDAATTVVEPHCTVLQKLGEGKSHWIEVAFTWDSSHLSDADDGTSRDGFSGAPDGVPDGWSTYWQGMKIDWGDGTVEDINNVGLIQISTGTYVGMNPYYSQAGDVSFLPAHCYQDDGTYTISVIAAVQFQEPGTFAITDRSGTSTLTTFTTGVQAVPANTQPRQRLVAACANLNEGSDAGSFYDAQFLASAPFSTLRSSGPCSRALGFNGLGAREPWENSPGRYYGYGFTAQGSVGHDIWLFTDREVPNSEATTSELAIWPHIYDNAYVRIEDGGPTISAYAHFDYGVDNDIEGSLGGTGLLVSRYDSSDPVGTSGQYAIRSLSDASEIVGTTMAPQPDWRPGQQTGDLVLRGRFYWNIVAGLNDEELLLRQDGTQFWGGGLNTVRQRKYIANINTGECWLFFDPMLTVLDYPEASSNVFYDGTDLTVSQSSDGSLLIGVDPFSGYVSAESTFLVLERSGLVKGFFPVHNDPASGTVTEDFAYYAYAFTAIIDPDDSRYVYVPIQGYDTMSDPLKQGVYRCDVTTGAYVRVAWLRHPFGDAIDTNGDEWSAWDYIDHLTYGNPLPGDWLPPGPQLLRIPSLRQLQRDDVERQFPRNGPTSIQASARQGPRGTYL